MLVNRSFKRSKVICKSMWSVLEDKEQDKDISRKIETEYSARETMATYINRLYYKVTSIKRSWFNFGSI